MADLAVGDGRAGAPPEPRPNRLASLADALAGRFAAEGERRVLWLPVWFGSGIAVYFSLTAEPPLWLGMIAMLAAGTAAIGLRRGRAAGAALAPAFAAAGFLFVELASWQCRAPMLDHRVGPVAVAGRVVDIDTLDRGWRVIVAPRPLPGLDPDEQPRLLRIHIAAGSDLVAPGDAIALRAMLYPVPAPILPGGRDMQRELYFAGIGGVGYSLGAARREAGAGVPAEGGWRAWLLRLRADMARRINTVLPGSTGGVAAALITGKRGGVQHDAS